MSYVACPHCTHRSHAECATWVYTRAVIDVLYMLRGLPASMSAADAATDLLQQNETDIEIFIADADETATEYGGSVEYCGDTVDVALDSVRSMLRERPRKG